MAGFSSRGRAPLLPSLCVLCGFAALPRRLSSGAWLPATFSLQKVTYLPSFPSASSSRPLSLATSSRNLHTSRIARSAGVQEIPGIKTTYEILKPGDGKTVAKGATVTVHATGVVKETGKTFWSTKDPGQEPFTYSAGVGQAPLLPWASLQPEVITGWDKGCLGMKVGEERKLVIPAAEGYGKGGFPAWGIPPGGTLEFTLECLSIS
eukprot:TRINITY_DN1632_c1_g1_i2.p1 TRINITY_DN1632_c1_g1~~TRINITY_DN1632_c1_g1_i2.p1  ORF type:complete len:242 (+),score=27.87 TRINITY_DN1632_c1_g1_i2:107-727(+)